MIGRRMLRRLLPRPLALAIRREVLTRRIADETAPVEGEIRLLPQFVRSTDVC